MLSTHRQLLLCCTNSFCLDPPYFSNDIQTGRTRLDQRSKIKAAFTQVSSCDVMNACHFMIQDCYCGYKETST